MGWATLWGWAGLAIRPGRTTLVGEPPCTRAREVPREVHSHPGRYTQGGTPQEVLPGRPTPHQGAHPDSVARGQKGYIPGRAESRNKVFRRELPHFLKKVLVPSVNRHEPRTVLHKRAGKDSSAHYGSAKAGLQAPVIRPP